MQANLHCAFPAFDGVYVLLFCYLARDPSFGQGQTEDVDPVTKTMRTHC